MLGLAMTATARAHLRALRADDPAMFAAVADRLREVRRDPGGRFAGRAFLLEDGRLARLVTVFDARRRADICLVWLIEEDADGSVVALVWAAPFSGDD